MSKNWTVNLYGVREEEAGRVEMPISEISEEELKKIVFTQNEKALKAAGYYPVEQKQQVAAR